MRFFRFIKILFTALTCVDPLTPLSAEPLSTWIKWAWQDSAVRS